MKNLKIKIVILAFITILSFAFHKGISQTLQDAVTVPIFEGTIVDNSIKEIYWDISEINNINNRLDLVAGVRQTGDQAPNSYYYTNGNWYKNQDNSNFNSEVTDNRFIYQTGDVGFNGITGLLFSRLNTSNSWKDVIVTKDDNQIYIFQNTGSSISLTSDFNFYANGKVAAVGKFTNDTLEDVAVISGSTLKIYKNKGNSTLDSVPVYTFYNVNADKVIITQVSNYINPYSIFNGTTGDRDEIIIKSGSVIKIYKNNNNNGISDSTSISISGGISADFKISDIDNDGFNDLIIAGFNDNIKIFKNTTGTISSSPFYSNTNYSFPSTVEVADFNKDGWNDIIITNFNSLYLFTNSNGTFPQTASYSKGFTGDFFGKKLRAVDLHSKGGLSVLFSKTSAILNNENEPELINTVENMDRYNATDTDAVPAPPIQFESYILKDGIYRPRIYIYNRGDRDFNKYRIYKRTPRLPDSLVYIGETTSNSFIDTTEYISVNPSGPRPTTFNCFYFSTCTDYTSHESIHSDTAKYLVGDDQVCMSCGEGGDAFSSISEYTSLQPAGNFSITNFPNPFNPSTKIYYTIQVSGNVKITVYNSLGQIVIELVNEFKQSGAYIAEFKGNNMSSGIYYYKIESGSFSQVKKMMLLK